MNERKRRIETLKMAIRWNEAFLRGVPEGSDPKAEDQLDADRAELERLLDERTAT